VGDSRVRHLGERRGAWQERRRRLKKKREALGLPFSAGLSPADFVLVVGANPAIAAFGGLAKYYLRPIADAILSLRRLTLCF
jgi:hypothetical protein